jgi:hypothetical protein
MLRKTLIALAATAALGIGAGTADARGGSAYSGSSSMHPSGSSGVRSPSGFSTPSHVPSGFSTPSHVTTMGPRSTTMGPRSRTWNGANWNGGRHHHRHDRFFFGAGFAGPFYGYGYDSCWRLAQTYYGWQRVWVCGDYPYWGY